MVSFSKLAELSSGNIGFNGGTAVDTMPHMGLTECADALTMYLYETTIADYEREEAQDDQLFEAAIEAISSGDSAILESAISAINEAEDKGSVWERIKGVFKKIAEFFKSLAAKAATWINSVVKDGPAFYAKYKDQFSKSTAKVKLKNLYKFDNADKDISIDVFDAISDIASGAKKPDAISPEEAKNALNSLKVEKSAVEKYVKDKVGCPEDKKYEDCFYGEKEDREVSSSDGAFVQKFLVSANPKTVKASYDLSAKNAQDSLRMCDASMGKDNDAGDLAAYAKAYSTLFNQVTSEINKAVSAKIKAYKAAINQAKRIMRAVVTGKEDDGGEQAGGTNAEQQPSQEQPANESAEQIDEACKSKKSKDEGANCEGSGCGTKNEDADLDLDMDWDF